MTRVKGGSIAKKRHKKVLLLTKGFKGSHSKLFKTANQQKLKSLQYSFFDRRKKKTTFKSIWIRRINAISKSFGSSYNRLMHKLKIKKIIINKKMLSEIIIKNKKIVAKLIEL